LTDKAIRRGSCVRVPDLKQAIEEFMRAWNQNSKPFISTARSGRSLLKIARARTKMAADAAPRGKEGGYSVMLFYTRAYLKIA